MQESKIMIHFETMEDHRQKGKIVHPMKNIVFIVLVGVLNGYSGWSELSNLAKYRRDFFEKYLDFSNGIPSEDTLRRFFQDLDPESFREHFREWVSSIVHGVRGKVVSIDGKRVRQATEMNGGDPIHIVSAWVAENEMVLGQLKVSGQPVAGRPKGKVAGLAAAGEGRYQADKQEDRQGDCRHPLFHHLPQKDEG